MRDSYGTIWYTDDEHGTRVPIDPEHEFGADWIGHAAGDDDGEITA